MKRSFILLPIILFASEFEIGGYLNLDTRLLYKDYLFNFNETKFDFYLKGSNEDFNFYNEIWIKEIGIKDFSNLYELSQKEKFSFIPEFVESYITLGGFPFDFMDITLGKQRTSWGTAYIFNPTDNIDPIDLEDIWDFGRRIASFSFKLKMFLGGTSIQTVFLPFFTPGRLPEEKILNVLYPELSQIQDKELVLKIPERNIKNSIFGLKLKRNILKTDISLSYVYGRSSLPFPDTIRILFPDIKMIANFVYPEMNIIGIDFATSIDRFGLWGEFGYFIPESLVLTTIRGVVKSDSTILSSPYYKYVLGADFRQDDRFYILLQYIYGFPDDAGDVMNDFFLLHSSFNFFDHRLELNLNYAFENYDFNDKEFSHLLAPEISYSPLSNIKITAGTKYIIGDYGKFGRLKDESIIYMIFKYNY
uniref:DUF1302 family protein n=1 Tax=candidate division WOR-3 bacterium TaxID=2052148 RepID=A0A7C4Y4Y2_UNCW3